MSRGVVRGNGWRPRRADLLATAGALLAALCCLGVPAVVGVVSALGAGFLIQDRVLLPVLAVTLPLGLWGLDRSRSVPGRSAPLWLGLAGSAALVAGLRFGAWLVAAGVVLLLAANFQNLRARRSQMSAAAPARHCEERTG